MGFRAYWRQRWPAGAGWLAAWLAAVALLLTLAWLQNRWIEQIAEAEKTRLAESLRLTSQRFARDFDRQVSLAYGMLAGGPPQGEAESRYARWVSVAPSEKLLRGWYRVQITDTREAILSRFVPDASRFEILGWPSDWDVLRRDLIARTPPPPPMPPPGAGFFPRPADPRTGFGRPPAVRRQQQEEAFRRPGASPFARADGLPFTPRLRMDFPAPILQETETGVWIAGPLPMDRFQPSSGFHWSVLELDRAWIAETLLPQLAREHFGDTFHARVVRTRKPDEVIFVSHPNLGDWTAPDERESLLNLPWRRGAPRGGFGSEPPNAGEPDDTGLWQLQVSLTEGNLPAVVAQHQRRNQLLGFGTLAVLGVGMGFLILATRRAQQLAKRQMEFVAAVSHELRTPLAVICSAGDNLADGVATTSEQTRRYGTLIQTQARRLAGLVEQTLGFAGIQRGKVRFHPEPAAVEALVREAIGAANREIAAAGAHVEIQVEEELPLVDADPVWLTQALRNLIANAVQYGGTWVGIRAHSGRGGVEIEVADRGPGLTSSDRAHVFEPFYRGRSAAARGEPGAGLGLSIVKQVVEGHGGSIRVASEPGQGAVFTVCLPASSASGAAATSGEPA